MHGLIADSPSGAWSTGAAILTFVFPMLLFIAVAAALYVLYTKPEVVPGHQVPSRERPVSYTAVPGAPAEAGAAARTGGDAAVAASADQTAATSTDQTAVTSTDQTAVTSTDQTAVTGAHQTAATSTDQTAVTSTDQTAVTSTDEAPATEDGA